ncbi:MAG: universal stress protein [Chthoniobacteraceae bacterium]
MRTAKSKSTTTGARSGGLKRILVPFDFSTGAEHALEHSVNYARRFKAGLTLVHIVHLPYLGIGFGPGEGLGMEDRLVGDATEQLAAIAARLERKGVAAGTVVRVGHPVRDVVDVARREGADMIVMGTHGRSGLKHALLGSVAEGVLRHAPCAVLVVR